MKFKIIAPLIASIMFFSSSPKTISKNNPSYIHYKNLIENKIPERVASHVFNPKFKVYTFLLKQRKSSSRPTYSSYLERINPKEKAEIAVKFLLNNYSLLRDIENKYGIKPLDLAALISIETSGGNYLGSFKMFNALYSQYLRFKTIKKDPFWSSFYEEQLRRAEFLIKNGYDLFSPSSLAGAIGITQFMPSSIYFFGIDADRDGKINLFNKEDALYSAANYLAKHGGREDIEKAYYYYNGHIWYVWALRKIRKRAKKIIEEKYKDEIEKLERAYLSPFIEKKLPSTLVFYLRETDKNYNLYFISSLDLLKELFKVRRVILYTSKEEITFHIPKKR